LGFFLYLQEQNNHTMKLKIIALVALGFLIYSCASKTPTPVAEKEIPAGTKIEPTTKDVGVLTVKGVMTKELSEGKNLFENNCAKCHKLYDPKSFSAENWKPILVKMQMKAHLDDTQIGSISNFINSQL